MSCIGIAMCLRKYVAKEANAERGIFKAVAKVLPAVLQMREVIWCNVRIMLGMFQVVSMLQNTLDVTYPPVFSILCHWMGLISADSSSLLTLFQFDCYVDPGNAFVYAWIVKVFGVPLFMALVILAMYCLDMRAEGEVEQDLSCDIGGSTFDKVATTKLKENVFNCVSLFYPWTSATIISALQCRQLGEGMSVLLHDYRVSCDTTTYSNAQATDLLRNFAEVWRLIWGRSRATPTTVAPSASPSAPPRCGGRTPKCRSTAAVYLPSP